MITQSCIIIYINSFTSQIYFVIIILFSSTNLGCLSIARKRKLIMERYQNKEVFHDLKNRNTI